MLLRLNCTQSQQSLGNANAGNSVNTLYEALEHEYFAYKTNYILKFGKNPSLFQKLIQHLEKVSEKNKNLLSQSIYRLKIISEKRDKVLMNTEKLPTEGSIDNFIKTNLNNWKDLMPLILDQEITWLKTAETSFCELKELNDLVIHLTKKLNEKESILKTREDEIAYLNSYIKENDINYKSLIIKKQNDKISQLKSNYQNREKVNLIKTLNLEEQIHELDTLLENEKKNIVLSSNIKENLEIKTKEVEDMKQKLSQEIEDKKMKIAYLSNERNDLQAEIDTFQHSMNEMQKKLDENSKKDIAFNTKLKLMVISVKQKDNIIGMLNEELNSVNIELQNERKGHLETKSLLQNFQERQAFELVKRNQSLMNLPTQSKLSSVGFKY